MKQVNIFPLIALFFLMSGCDRQESNWWIKGQIKNDLNGAVMNGITIRAEVKKLQSGVYNDIISTVSEDQTDGEGQFELSWKRENISFGRLVASKSQYFDAIVEVSPDDMRPGEPFVQNVHMTPRSDVLINLSSSDPSALIKFSVFSADDFCSCNDEAEYEVVGLVDTTIACMTGGGKWLKYQIQAFGSGGNVYHLDSVFCEPFITTQIQYSY